MADLTGRPPVMVDAMCGRLARALRMAGWNAAYVGDRGLERAVCLDSTAIEGQLVAIRRAGGPLEIADPPTCCGRCNGVLVPELPELERPAYAPDDPDTACWRCDQYFWRGSHWARMRRSFAELDPS